MINDESITMAGDNVSRCIKKTKDGQVSHFVYLIFHVLTMRIYIELYQANLISMYMADFKKKII